MDTASTEVAFPVLTDTDIATIVPMGIRRAVADGSVLYHAGQPDIDLNIVENGAIEILNPSDNRRIALHVRGGFSGDIDLLTRRPTVVTAIARGETQLITIPCEKVCELLMRHPQIGEKLLDAFRARRILLTAQGNIGLKVYGGAECPQTNLIREFLDKNFVPYTWFRRESSGGCSKADPDGSGNAPMVDCGDGVVLTAPTLQHLAKCAGVWRECPKGTVDLAIVGAGPAGMSAAVYAASEGLSTLVLDQLGPGGQAAASSKIENFIGFPSGLSGTELATRAVIQMLKFGAQIVAPVSITRMEKAVTPGEPHLLYLDCGNVVRATNVLIASGLTWRRLEALGSSRLEHAGIHYACTSTEAVSHGGDEAAVVGAGNSAGQAAMFLAERYARTVHIIMRGDDLGASMSSYLVNRILSMPNIVVHYSCQITKIIEDGRLHGVEVCDTEGDKSIINVAALYVFIGAEPQIDWLPAEVARDEKGFLLTGGDAAAAGEWPLSDRAPCALETTIPHLFAAGDVRSSSTKRVGFAVGDGALAVACVHTLRPHNLAPH
jgi:thioredoxin reductase (NADPH)